MDDKATKGQTNNGLDSHERAFPSCDQSRPPYELYEKGVNEFERGWIGLVLAFLKDRSGGEVVTIAAILALFGIARAFIGNGNDGLDGLELIGALVAAALILAVAALAIRQTTKAKHATHTQENQSKETQSGVGVESPHEDGATSG